MKYKRKPTVVEADQITEKNMVDVADKFGGWIVDDKDGYICILTLTGVVHARVGEWLVNDDGHIAAYRPPAFNRIYEVA